MSSVKVWLVSPVMRKCTELNAAVLLRDNARTVLNNMRALCPDAQFTICTSECATHFAELNVIFSNGKFYAERRI